jgi:hypothetical protein
VKNAIKSFRPGIPISGKLISVSRKTVEHFIGSNYTDSLRNHDTEMYEDKLQISQNIDDVIYASTNYINEGLIHQRDDNIIEFARGSVLLDIGGKKYEAQVLVGYTTMKELLLYDIQDMVPANFTIKTKRTQPSLTGNKSDIRKTAVSSKPIIRQKDGVVNPESEKNIDKADLADKAAKMEQEGEKKSERGSESKSAEKSGEVKDEFFEAAVLRSQWIGTQEQKRYCFTSFSTLYKKQKVLQRVPIPAIKTMTEALEKLKPLTLDEELK